MKGGVFLRKPAEIITKIMTMFTNNVKIGEVESEKFALHLI